MSWAGLRRQADTVVPALAAELADGTWQPDPVETVRFDSYTGKPMTIVVPTVRDRLVHRVLRNAVEPVLEALVFADWVSGFRPGRSRVTALRQAMVHHDIGLRWVADVDVASVSESVGIDDVVGWFAAHVHDGSFLALVRTALAGLPSPLAPGSGLAPLMLNLRLSRADALLAGVRVVRFADNYCAFATDALEAQRAFAEVIVALGRCGMAPNVAKSRVRGPVNVEDLFLIGG